MNIAKSIKGSYKSEIENGNYDNLISECEKKGEVDNNWEDGATGYDFVDGSTLVICGSYVWAY